MRRRPVAGVPKSRRPFLFGLGVASEDTAALRVGANAVHERLDALRRDVNAAAAAAELDRDTAEAFRVEIDRVGADATAVLLGADAVRDASGLRSLQMQLEAAQQETRALRRELEEAIPLTQSSRSTQIIIWGGAAVALAVGTGLFVRYLGRRR